MSAVNWKAYRKCRVCGALLGEPCIDRCCFPSCANDSQADRPHSGRKLRKGYEQ